MSACWWLFLHLDEWPWFLNIYKARLLQICYVMYFCNVYAWILRKYQLRFDFSSGFYSASKALSTPLPCIMIIVLLKSAFLFFLLTSGRPLRVSTFFVFSKPLCSHFAATLQCRSWFRNFFHCCKSAVYRCQRAFHCSAKQPKFATAAASPFTALL